MSRNGWLWAAYALFVALALWGHGPEPLFWSNSPLPAGKAVAWAAYLGFLAYSIHCSRHEDLIATIGQVGRYHWGRQIGLDLYLGLGFTLFIVYLTEGSVWAVLLWLLPTLPFANLATLLYVATHYDRLVGHFLP